MARACLQVSLSSTVAHENMVQLLDVFAEGTELIIVVSLCLGQHCSPAVNMPWAETYG